MFSGKLIAIGLIFLSFIVCSNLYAQDKKAILEHHWSGGSRMEVDFTKTGVILIKHDMDLTVNSFSSISGTVKSTFKIDGYSYICTAKVSGSFNTYTNMLTYKTGTRIREDKLPYGLYWCDSWGTLELANHASAPGYYLLKGTQDDSCGGTGDVEFSDR